MDITTPENRLTLLPAILCIYPHLSVLVFTALWSPETALEIGKLGVQGHLEKAGHTRAIAGLRRVDPCKAG